MSKFDERRAKIDAAAVHGNPQFGRDQLEALRAQAENDSAEALTALVGLVGELVDRLGGWQRIGAVTLPDGTEVVGTIPESAIVGETPEPDDLDDDLDDDLEVGDRVGVIGEVGDDRSVGTVTSTGVGEGRAWAIVDGDGFPEGAKLWADQLERIDETAPAPTETARTNPEDGAEQRRLAALAHLEHVVDEPKVEYEQATYDAGKDGREFDVPIGMQGAPVKVKSKGGNS